MKEKQTKRRKTIAQWFFTFLLVSCFGTSLSAQTANITGSVKDVSGQPLAGVRVVVDKTTKAVVTNGMGVYTIAAGKGDELLFDMMGFSTKRITVGEQSTINVILNELSQDIDEVVVLGYGSNVKRVDLIGSVASVDADLISQRAPTNVFEALRGQMAGVQITSNSGAPGAGINIRVRGVSTLDDSGVNPLYIVDGIVMDDIDHISPNNIQSIDILKDAASAAIYGSRAANGVVMITTKTSRDGKLSANVRFLQSFGYLSNRIPQMNNEEFWILSNTVISAASKDQFRWFGTDRDSLDLRYTTSYDYQKIISQTAKRTEAGVDVSGGSEKVKYFTSLNYLDETGVILTSFNNRINFQAKVDYKPSKIFRIATNVQAAYREFKDISEGSTFYNAIRRVPFTLLYFPTDGNYVSANHAYPNNGKRNPLIEIYEREDKTNRYDITLNEEMQFFITPHLNLIGRATASFYYSEREQYNSPWIQTNLDLVKAGSDRLTLTDRFYQRYQAEAFLNYSRQFGKHYASGMVGTSVEDIRLKTTITGGSYVMDSSIKVPQSTAEPQTASVVPKAGNSMASAFGRVEYNYMSRYMFSATLRRDGSSRFGTKNRWGWFPAVQGGWRFSDHFQGTKLSDYITDGKLRVSWGKVGNDRIGNYDAQTLYQGTIGAGYDGKPGTISTSTYGNPSLKWEETTSTNFGLDLRLFNGRASFTADYYIKKTKDMLDNEDIPTELGYNSMRVNVGSVRNRGIELSLEGTIIDTKDWFWHSSINWSRNKNKVLSIAGNEGRILTNNVAGWWVEPGRSAGLFYGYKHLGVYAYDVSNAYTSDFSERLIPQFERDSYGNVKFDADQKPILKGYKYKNGKPYDGEIAKMTINGTEARGGDVIWDDYDGNGNITDEDRQVLGNGYPDWFAGWNNTVRWRNFSLDFSFYYNRGGLIYNKLLRDLSSYGDNTSNCDPRGLIQGWRFQGQITDWFIPGQNVHATENNRQLSSFYLEDGSFLRLSNIRLSYRLSESLAKKLYTKGIQVYVYGNNLLTWTDYRGYDPETGGNRVLTPGLDNQTYPRQRTIGFGVNISF